jgi:hypothetical protein
MTAIMAAYARAISSSNRYFQLTRHLLYLL